LQAFDGTRSRRLKLSSAASFLGSAGGGYQGQAKRRGRNPEIGQYLNQLICHDWRCHPTQADGNEGATRDLGDTMSFLLITHAHGRNSTGAAWSDGLISFFKGSPGHRI